MFLPAGSGCIHWCVFNNKGTKQNDCRGVWDMCPQENFDIYMLRDPLLILDLQDIFSAAEGLL